MNDVLHGVVHKSNEHQMRWVKNMQRKQLHSYFVPYMNIRNKKKINSNQDKLYAISILA